MSAVTGDLPAAGYNPAMYELLKRIHDPAQVRALDRRQIGQLADELRAYVLDSVSKTGGPPSPHPGSGQGAIALPSRFSPPEDRNASGLRPHTHPHQIPPP